MEVINKNETYSKNLDKYLLQKDSNWSQTEIGLFPSDWKMAALNDISLIIDGDRGFNYPKNSDFHNDGFCLFLSAKNVTKRGFKLIDNLFITQDKDNSMGKGKLAREDIILTTRGSVGNIAYFDSSIPYDDIRINSGMVIIRKTSSDAYNQYLYITFNSHIFKNQIKKIMFGSAQPQLTVRGIQSLSVPLPPLPEQKAIAQALSDVDDLISSLDALIEKKRNIKQGTMQELLTGKRRLPGFSGEWIEKRLGDISNSIASGKSKMNKNIGPYPVYGSTGILGFNNVFDYEGPVILVARVGANAGLLHKANGKYCVSDNTLTIELQSELNKDFFFYLLIYKKLNKLVFGSGQPLITGTQLKNLLLKVPPFDEQSAIAKTITDMDVEILKLEHQREKTKLLKQGMMQELLTGKTRLL